jgi:serine/threonine protein kinase/Tfp pilus assembly protein PilF
MACPADETILGFIEETLGADEAEEVKRHVDACADCRTLLVQAARSFSPSAGVSQVGRYEIVDLIGAGGMGVVYRARDPLLNREVALKLLWRAEKTRLLGEAEAMARLSHPNVVTVYDAGSFHDRVFLAMERVAGETLGAWLKQPRARREILAAFCAAGCGLAAAHAAGLVHRDFKPDNVLYGSDGRVRVTDFGLARTGIDPESDSSGTPAYMAPEQFLGAGADARSDQFSFCVALYEALYGERPFRGNNLEELRRAVTSGEMVRRPGGALGRVLLRGLSVKPEARFPSMEALIATLERRPRRLWPLLFVPALAIAFVSLRPDPRCHQPPFDHARRLGLRTAMPAYLWPRVEQLLDEYSGAFAAAQKTSCGSPAALECLDDRREELEALTDLLSRSPENAVESIAKLTPPASCTAVRAKPRPKDTATIRRTLAQAEALERVGRYADGIALLQPQRIDYLPLEAEALYLLGTLHGEAGEYREAESLLERAASAAEASGQGRLTARAWIALVYFVGVKSEKADRALEWSRFAEAALARLGGDDKLEAERAFALARLLRAQGHANEALAQFERAGKLGADQAETLLGMSSIYESQGRHREAAEANQRALEISETALGREHPKLIPLYGHQGVLLVVEGRFDDALAAYQRALAIGEKTVGPEHVLNAPIHSELGQLLGRLGRFDEGRDHLMTALRLTEHAVGPEHSDTAAVLDNLGTLHLYAQQPDQALEYQRRALAIFEKAVGPEHPRVGRVLHHMSASLIAEKKWAEALDCAERARAITEKAYGPDGRDLGVTLTLIAEAQLGLGNPGAALESAARALALRQERQASSTSIADTRFVLARATLDAKHDRAAARVLALEARDAYAAAKGARAGADLARVQAWLDAHGK